MECQIDAQLERYDPRRLLRMLHDNGVDYVVIGGVAGWAHGSPSATYDLDICYDRGRHNLEALARVLQAAHARLRGAPPDLPFKPDARALAAGDHFTFSTDFGDFDCLGTPAGTSGYADLARRAVEVDLAGVPVKVVSLDDLMQMKRASGRPKDLRELEILGALRDEIDGEDQ